MCSIMGYCSDSADRKAFEEGLARTVSLPAICRSSFVWDGSKTACPGVEAIIFHYMEK